MAELEEGVDQVVLGVAARHALHDEELVAAFAADGLDDESDRARARSLVERCGACRDLHADVLAIGEALHVSATFTASLPRDFRLSEADALRLGGYVSPRGLLAGLARALAGVGRPLGASMAALGIVGLLVGTMSLGPAAAPGNLAIDAGATRAPGELAPGYEPQATGGTTAVGPGSSTDRQGDGVAEEGDFDPTRSSSTTLTLLSAALLVGGILLLVIGARGRRPGQH